MSKVKIPLSLNVYLVGGAVRDELLSLDVKDKDWVITGSSSDEMLSLGFQKVGKDFPVFLHPQTKEEYALARTERKSGVGYTGFVCDSSASVTLEDDLMRRDLTINAIAKDKDNNIIDPYHGVEDLNNRLLRHVSPAFKEDPLRVLRVARFAARFADKGFQVAPETLELMSSMVEEGELGHLVAERVWKEMSRALMESNPQVFFEVLRQCGALKVLLPEIDSLFGVPNPKRWHPEIDTGVHVMMVLKQTALRDASLPVRFSCLTHDLGKALTPVHKLPSHPGHEFYGIELVNTLCNRLKVPNDCAKLATLVCEYHTHTHIAFELKPTTILKLFNKLDAWRKPDRFHEFLLACMCDATGRKDFEDADYPQAQYLADAFAEARQVVAKPFVEQGFQGKEIKEAMDKVRLEYIRSVKERQS